PEAAQRAHAHQAEARSTQEFCTLHPAPPRSAASRSLTSTARRGSPTIRSMRPFLVALAALAAFATRPALAEEPVPAVATSNGGAAQSATPTPTPPPPLPLNTPEVVGILPPTATVTTEGAMNWHPRASQWPVQLTLGWALPI